MSCSIKRDAMLLWRLALAALMGLFVLVCFAQPAAPQVNIEIMVEEDGDYVRLTWEPVEGAESYNIYASTEVDPEDWGEPLATVGEEVTEYITEDSVDELGSAFFFYVTAFAEPGIPDWLVLVDGDLFNGDITIDPFYISKYQVTQEEWIEVMGNNPSHFADEDGVPNHENLPVERVSWFDIIEYCNRLSINKGLTPAYTYNGRSNPDDWYEQWPGWNEDRDNHTNVSCDWEADGYRLPTETEWHHAANGAVHNPDSEWPFGSPFQYAGSNDIDEVAWYTGNSDIGDGQGRRTHPVGGLAHNGLGIYDMSGNVWEWVWDIDGGTWPPDVDNPHGADGGTHRVARGGLWAVPADFCTVSYRNRNRATVRSNGVGFRVARNVTPPPEERMVFVEGGELGNDQIPSFYVGKYQVTQSEYESVMGINPSHFEDNPNNPVEMVSWFDAVEYCNRLSMREGLTPAYSYLGNGTNPDDWPEGWNTVNANQGNVSCDWETDGYRLPTEMEWEFAARGGVPAQEADPSTFNDRWAGTNDLASLVDYAWYRPNAFDVGEDHPNYGTNPVGGKLPNELGLYDMSGNVADWTWTSQWQPWGTFMIIRGGRWRYNENDCAVTYRNYDNAATRRLDYIGFRLVRNAPPRDRMVLVDGDQFNGNVNIDPFYISKYQVTRAEFRDIMGADWGFTHPNPGDQPEPTDNNYPANRLSWFDAVEYCNRVSIREGLTPAYTYNGRSNPDDWYEQWPGWNEDNDNHTNISCDWEADGYRLPTEAEWHHAANGGVHDPESEWPFGSPYQYAGSNDADEVAWYSGYAGGTTHPVGELAPNGLGIYDMSGNVFEWVWDRWGGTFPSGNDNPRGDGTHATGRVRRGGSFVHATANSTVSYRYFSDPVSLPHRYYGFRVSRVIP